MAEASYYFQMNFEIYQNEDCGYCPPLTYFESTLGRPFNVQYEQLECCFNDHVGTRLSVVL